jgi:tetratricopeptide (TPR) repeat protein
MKRFDLAVVEFLKVLEKNAGDDKARYLLATAYEENKNNKSAQEEYSKISFTSDLYTNARIHAGMILKKEGKLPEAITLLKESIIEKKGQVPLYLYLSSLYEENKDLSNAESILKQGIENSPKSVDLHYSLGVIYEKTNRFPESIKEMETVLRIDPDNADALNFIGYSYADRGLNLDEAEKMIIKALKIKPDSGYMIDSLGWVYFKQGKFDSALLHLKKAMEIMPADAAIIEHLGDVYVKLDRLQEAREMYEKALKIDPKNKSVQNKLDNLKKNK